ncbi:hypothetical protein SteCoe_2408 [Stentor coeruleus]|uniref:Globin family profile domain-containing protein n=1 Tax=Stentor coeruleus TaxID=5963 RepID=A0A1R2CZD6_9CILI|nr:hypothetical protein SteCoe_2408 [Stentor coeruleus]
MNLFEKYGGSSFWSEFLNTWYSRVTCSDSLSNFFSRIKIEDVKTILLGILESTLISEGNYPKDVLGDIHKRMNISDSDFNIWKKIYESILNDMGISNEDSEKILTLIEGYRSCIVSIT